MFVNDLYHPNIDDNANFVNGNNDNNNNNIKYFNRVYLCVCKPNPANYGIYNIAYKPFTSIEEADMYKRIFCRDYLTKIVPMCKYTPTTFDNIILGYKFKKYISNKIV